MQQDTTLFKRPEDNDEKKKDKSGEKGKSTLTNDDLSITPVQRYVSTQINFEEQSHTVRRIFIKMAKQKKIPLLSASFAPIFPYSPPSQSKYRHKNCLPNLPVAPQRVIKPR